MSRKPNPELVALDERAYEMRTIYRLGWYEIGKRLGCRPAWIADRVRRYRHRNGLDMEFFRVDGRRTANNDRDARVVERYRAGESARKIGLDVGLSHSRVLNIIDRLAPDILRPPGNHT